MKHKLWTLLAAILPCFAMAADAAETEEVAPVGTVQEMDNSESIVEKISSTESPSVEVLQDRGGRRDRT